MRTATLVAASALLGCAPPPAPSRSPTAPAPSSPVAAREPAPDPDDGQAPTPFTAQQIRDASREGRTYEYLVERPNKPAIRRKMVFIAVSDERATIASSEIDPAGKEAPAGDLADATWEELRRHASFAKAETTIDEDRSETPVGVFECRRYTVVRATAEGLSKDVFWFAKQLPGPPVEIWRTLDGETIERSTLLQYAEGLP